MKRQPSVVVSSNVNTYLKTKKHILKVVTETLELMIDIFTELPTIKVVNLYCWISLKIDKTIVTNLVKKKTKSWLIRLDKWNDNRAHKSWLQKNTKTETGLK